MVQKYERCNLNWLVRYEWKFKESVSPYIDTSQSALEKRVTAGALQSGVGGGSDMLNHTREDRGASLVLCATAVWVWCDQINHIWTFTAKKKKTRKKRRHDSPSHVLPCIFFAALEWFSEPSSQFTDSFWIGSVLHLSGVRLFDGHQREKPPSKGDWAQHGALGRLCYVFRKLPPTSRWWTLWCPVWLSAFLPARTKLLA